MSKQSSGLGFFGAMFLLFLGLKLTGYIDWSWWWIFAPLWGPAVFVLVVVIIVVVFNLD